MKVVTPNSNNNGGRSAKVPLLSLVPDEDHELNSSNSLAYNLRTKPSDADSPTYKVYIRQLNGAATTRQVIRWCDDTTKVARGLDVTGVKDKYFLWKDTLVGSALTLYEAKAKDAATTAFRAAVAAETNDAAKQRVRDQGWERHLTEDDLILARRAVVSGLVPKKALARVKRYLRRDLRKPVDMKVRPFYQHLLRINDSELPGLPPFRVAQNMPDDEITDILLAACPRSWERKMDEHGFDPIGKTASEVVDFMEQIETAEEFPSNKTDNGSSKKKTKTSDGKKKSSNGTKCCAIHGKCAHTTEECRDIQKAKGGSGGKSYGNKTWNRKASEAADKSKKELQSFIKAQVAKGIKEMNSIDKKRPAIRDDDSDEEMDLHAFDLKDFNYKDDDLKIDSSDEVSV